jgi:hypothetical protein
LAEPNLEVIAAKFALDRLQNTLYDIADQFVAAGDTDGGFFEIVLLGKEARFADVSPLFESALREKGFAIPTRGEAAVIVARDYLCAMLGSGTIDVYKIRRDIYDLVHETETEEQARALELIYLANEACDYLPSSKEHLHYKEACEKEIRALCEHEGSPSPGTVV